jgi:hypothetical protein
MAGDPTQFPEQVAAARNRVGMSNRTEGLLTWQPKKLYYATDAFEDFGPYWHDSEDLSPYRKNFLDGTGPSYTNTDVSPSKHETYAKLTAEYQVFYLTQEGYLGIDALKTGDLTGFNYPDRLIFGKSLVGGSITGDVFQHIASGPIPYAPVADYVREAPKGLALKLEGPWAFYEQFWKAHDLERLAKLIPVPEVSITAGETLHIPLRLTNLTKTSEDFVLTPMLPSGWHDRTRYFHYPVAPGESYPVDAALVAPTDGNRRWQEISWKAEAGGRQIGSVTMRVYVSKSGGLPE